MNVTFAITCENKVLPMIESRTGCAELPLEARYSSKFFPLGASSRNNISKEDHSCGAWITLSCEHNT